MAKEKKPENWQLPPLDKSEFIREQRLERKEKYPIYILTLVGIIFALGVAIFIGSGPEQTRTLISNISSNNQPDEEEEEEKIVFTHLAYTLQGNVWILNLETNEKHQVTTDGNETVPYNSLAWKNPQELSFTRCEATSCKILTYSLNDQQTSTLNTVDAVQIYDLRYSHSGNTLAYLYKKDDVLHSGVRVNGTYEEIYQFKGFQQEIVDFNEALYIRFTPDDNRIMVVNTHSETSGNAIWVWDLYGNLLTTIPSDEQASFGVFLDNDTICYKKGNTLYKQSISSKEEVALNDRISEPFHITTSEDLSRLAYWTYDYIGGVTTIWVYDIDSQEIHRVFDRYLFPIFIDNEELVAQKIAYCNECPLHEIEPVYLSRINLDTRSDSKIVDEENLDEVAFGNF